MEANSELQMKLRQRRARMGEDAALTNVANTMPEQELVSSVEAIAADVKVKQRRSAFEVSENRHANGQTVTVIDRSPHKETPQRVSPRAPPLRNTSIVEPPMHSASPALCSRSPPLRSVSPVLRSTTIVTVHTAPASSPTVHA